MFTRFQLAKKYLHYYLTASNGKGHGIHSPFVFDFVKHVLNDKKTPVDGIDGLKPVIIGLAAKKSYETGLPVKI